MTLSRREWFSAIFLQRRESRDIEPSRPAAHPRSCGAQARGPLVAVVQGRHCLAYNKVLCSSCYERCPVEGAISVEQMIPRIFPAICTGCGICKEVCPAPTNAILLIPKKRV